MTAPEQPSESSAEIKTALSRLWETTNLDKDTVASVCVGIRSSVEDGLEVQLTRQLNEEFNAISMSPDLALFVGKQLIAAAKFILADQASEKKDDQQ